VLAKPPKPQHIYPARTDETNTASQRRKGKHTIDNAHCFTRDLSPCGR
jgi:hypothetical protein